MQQRVIDEDGIDAVASTATSPAPVDPGAVVSPAAGPFDASRHSTKVPRSRSETHEPSGRGQEHRSSLRGRGESVVSALAGLEPRRKGSYWSKRRLDRLFDDRLSP